MGDSKHPCPTSPLSLMQITPPNYVIIPRPAMEVGKQYMLCITVQDKSWAFNPKKCDTYSGRTCCEMGMCLRYGTWLDAPVNKIKP